MDPGFFGKSGWHNKTLAGNSEITRPAEYTQLFGK